MADNLKLIILLSIIIFIISIILGLVFSEFVLSKKARLTGAYIEQNENLKQDLENLLNKQVLTQEDKNRLLNIVNRIIENCGAVG